MNHVFVVLEDDKRGHKIIIGVLQTENYPASNGVKRNYAGKLFNISYGGVIRMFLWIVGIFIYSNSVS